MPPQGKLTNLATRCNFIPHPDCSLITGLAALMWGLRPANFKAMPTIPTKCEFDPQALMEGLVQSNDGIWFAQDERLYLILKTAMTNFRCRR